KGEYRVVKQVGNKEEEVTERELWDAVKESRAAADDFASLGVKFDAAVVRERLARILDIQRELRFRQSHGNAPTPEVFIPHTRQPIRANTERLYRELSELKEALPTRAIRRRVDEIEEIKNILADAERDLQRGMGTKERVSILQRKITQLEKEIQQELAKQQP